MNKKTRPSSLSLLTHLANVALHTHRAGRQAVYRRSKRRHHHFCGVHHRLPFLVLALLIITISGATSLTGSLLEQRHQAAEELQEKLGDVEEGFSAGKGLHVEKARLKQRMYELEGELDHMHRNKVSSRKKLVDLRKEATVLKEEYDIDVDDPETVAKKVSEEEGKFVSFLRYLRAKREGVASDEGLGLGVSLLKDMMHASLGEMHDVTIHRQIVEQTKRNVFYAVVRAKSLIEDIAFARDEHDDKLDQYHAAWNEYTDARRGVARADARIAGIAKITEEVHSQILRLQSDIARIDARLREKLERDLIEKGLMTSRPGESGVGKITMQQTFQWPARGRISAGFHNAEYHEYFGVAHKGIDIVIPQGTAVRAAADGIVFLSRFGGQHGYSYVLIGHRDGYATLYGHLSRIYVEAGQEIEGGQVLGASGGKPGTAGAGPMTTGPHLHFEVISNGTHVDPFTVLN